MKKLELNEISKIEGGGKNRDCLLMGGLAFGAVLIGRYDAAIGAAFGAVAYGCFDDPN